jgi:hypothetical protein
LVLLKLKMSTTRVWRQKLHKVAQFVFKQGQSWKNCYFQPKIDQKLHFFKKKMINRVKQRTFELILYLDISSSKVGRKNLHKLAQLGFAADQSWKNCNFWPKIVIFQIKNDMQTVARNFFIHFAPLHVH